MGISAPPQPVGCRITVGGHALTTSGGRGHVAANVAPVPVPRNRVRRRAGGGGPAHDGAGVGQRAPPNHPLLEARMWALIFRRLRLIVVAAVLLPVIGAVSRRLADRTERRHSGPTAGSRGLRLVESS